MAITSDYQQEDHQPNPIVENENPSSLPFTANLDPSNPHGFLKSTFTFLSLHSDLLNNQSAEDNIISIIRSLKANAKMAEEEKKETHADAEASTKNASKEDKKQNVLHAPNKASGLDMYDHSWGQYSLCEVNVTVPVPCGTRSRLVLCEIKREHLKVGVKGQNPIIDEELFEPVTPGDCFWTLEDNKAISILMAKSKDMCWKSLFKGGPEIDPLKAEQTSMPPHWDTESWSLVQKMMFIERQKLKLLGLPTSDEIMKRGILDNILALERHNPNIKLDSNKLRALMMQTLGVDVTES